MPAARIILNADDFGLSAGIDRGILELLGRGRLSAVSAMASAPLWPQDGAALASFADVADLGLHFTLTEIAPPSAALRRPDGAAFEFGEIQSRAWRWLIDRNAVRAELERQWRLFAEVIGRAPDHLDSHQHVHQLPVVRDAVLEFLTTLAPSERPYVRTCVERPGAILRRGVHRGRALAFSMAGRQLRRELVAARVRTNNGFSGVYDFKPGAEYRHLFQRFLRDTRNTTIVLCHPAAPGMKSAGDPIADARAVEFSYLASDAMAADLKAAGSALERFGA